MDTQTRPTALVVSAYTDLARAFGQRLVDAGYGVRLVTDPMQALVAIENSAPAAILLERRLLPTGGLMFLRVLRAHTDVKTVPAVGFGSSDEVPAAVLAEAEELGLLEQLPAIGETWTVDRYGSARPQSPTETMADTGRHRTIGPIAIVQTKHGSVPISIQAASAYRIDVTCSRGQFRAGDTLRMVVREMIPSDDGVQEVNVRILAEVARVGGGENGSACSLAVAAASPPEDYDAFVRWMANR